MKLAESEIDILRRIYGTWLKNPSVDALRAFSFPQPVRTLRAGERTSYFDYWLDDLDFGTKIQERGPGLANRNVDEHSAPVFRLQEDSNLSYEG